MKLNATEQLISDYRTSLESSSSATYRFLLKNRKSIVRYLGRASLNEMILNYRALFRRDQKNKIMRDFKKYIMTKAVNHKSDFAIGYNIVKYVKVYIEEERMVVDYMFSKLADNIVKNVNYLEKLSSVYFIKKHLVMNHLQDNFLSRI